MAYREGTQKLKNSGHCMTVYYKVLIYKVLFEIILSILIIDILLGYLNVYRDIQMQIRPTILHCL